MIIRGATLFGRVTVFFAILFAFTACGGGGGGGGSFLGNSNALELVLLDPDGNKTSAVTSERPGTLRVKLASGEGNIVVNAETDLGTLTSGTALTNNSGVALFQIFAGTERGAGTIRASAAATTGTVTGTLGFQVGSNNLFLGYFDDDGSFIQNAIRILPKSTLAAGGNAQLSVVVLDDNGERITTPERVQFTSGCISGGQATINPTSPVTVNGQASTLYTAAGCAGTDEITASLVGAQAQAFGTMLIASARANAVSFISAEPTLIVLRGTGGQGRDETADIIFEVVDGTGQPLAGTTVNFTLSTFVGGLALSKESVLSDGDGRVSVTIQAGDVSTVVRVIATVDDGTGDPVSTVSDLLTVTTGLPDQNSVSLALSGCGSEGSFVVDGAWTIDGLCRQFTVFMADKFNNPVVDGTSAVFTTEYGSIVGSCTTTGGTCSVEWTSQAPRIPTLTGLDFVRTIFTAPGYSCASHNESGGPCPDDLGFIRGGRSSILVHAIGEESFVDRNGNGVMDESEKDLFQNMPEAFLDINEDGWYTPALPECVGAPMGSLSCISGQEEIFVDFNANETYDLNNEPAVYNGLLCPPEGDGVWCSRELIHVRAHHVVTLGNAPEWFIMLVRNRNETGISTASGQSVYISDRFNNPPPAGTTVELSTEDNCEIVGETSFEVFNYSHSGAFGFFFQTKQEQPDPPDNPLDPTPPVEEGSVTISFSTPESSTSRTVPCG